MNRNLRVGLVGLGSMGKNHARILSGLDGVDFLGIVETNPNGVKAFMKVPIYENLSELITRELDYCVISTPTYLHKDIALQFLESGVNLLIEKPVAIDYLSSLEIQHAAIRNNLVVGIGHIERCNPAINELKMRLLEGQLGQIYQVSVSRQGPYPNRISDVGVVLDLSTHDIDIVTWITGEKFNFISAHSLSRSNGKNEDIVAITGLLTGGIIANILVNWINPLKERSIRIIGERGTFEVDLLNSDLTFYENGLIQIHREELLHFKGPTQGNVYKYAFEKPEPLLVEHENFRDSLLGISNQIVTIGEGIEIMKVAEAVIESSAQNKTIEINPNQNR